jgi:Flp pilus assembly protein TadD
VSASAHNTLGTLLASTRHRREARREYERAVQLEPDAAYALNNLCYLSFLEGDTSQAVAECQAALAVDPDLTAARETLASLARGNARAR